jgi:hypothetical protein
VLTFGADGVPVLVDPAAISEHEQFVHGNGGHTPGLIGDGGVYKELDMLGVLDVYDNDHTGIDPYQDEDREDLAAAMTRSRIPFMNSSSFFLDPTLFKKAHRLSSG